MTSMNNWNIFVIWVDTFPDYRNVINNQGQRGSSDIDIGGGDSGDTCCWYPPPLIYVSRGSAMDICIRSPLPRFLDNRVVLLPIWKLPRAGAPVPAAISDKCYCLWDQGRAEGDFHCLSKAKCFMSVSTKFLDKIWSTLPYPPFRHDLRRRMSILKKCIPFSFLSGFHILFFIKSDWPGSILMCL